LRFLEEKGFIIYPIIKAFIEEFYRLNIEYINRLGLEDNIEIDPLSQIGTKINSEYFRSYALNAKEDLIVIGSAYDEYATLLLTKSGKIYDGVGSQDMKRLGNNVYEAFNYLMDNCTN